MKPNRISKYAVIQALWVVFLVFALLGGAPQVFGADEIVVCTWGGDFSKTEKIAFFDPFEKETGIKIKIVSFPEYAKMKAMVMTQNLEWDVVTAELKWVLRGAKEGLFEPLDFNVIDTKDFLPDTVHPSGFGVMSEAYTHAICYNTNKFSEQNHPRTWKEFFDVNKFPGPRSLYNSPMSNLEIALVSDGVPPDKLYPLDVDRAFRYLDKIKPNIQVWYKSLAQTAQLVATQEVHLICAGPPRMFFIRKEGAPVNVEFNQAIADKSFWVVLKGSKQKANAMKLINSMTRPKPQADWVNMYPFGVANKKAYDYIKPEMLPWIPTSPVNLPKLVWLSSEWWAENEAKMYERWNEWMVKK